MSGYDAAFYAFLGEEEPDSIFKRKDYVKEYDFAHHSEKENPLNEPHVFSWPEGAKFVLTMKCSLNFECQEAENTEEDMTRFESFAMRKSGLTVVKFYETKDEPETLDRAWYFRPTYYYMFLWDKEGNCVNGAY